MATPVVTVAAGGLPVVDVTSLAPKLGLPVTEALNGRGIAVTKVAANGLPVTFSTVADYPPGGGGALAAPLDAVANVTGAWSLSRNMLTAFGAGTRYTKTGSAIISVMDQTGNGRHMADQGVSIRRPVETTAFPAGVLCADFDGSNSYLTDGVHVFTDFFTVSSAAMVISVIIDAVIANDVISYGNHAVMAETSGYMGLYARNFSGVTFYAYNNDGTEDAPSATGLVGTPYVLMWRHHGGIVYLSVNGGAEVSVASGNTAGGGAPTIGFGYSSKCNMKFAEAFTTSNGNQTAALSAAITNMKTYVGIP
jgi:hypothetical protein